MKQIKIKDLHFEFAEARAETADKKQFGGIAYSGKPIFQHPYWGNLIFDTSSIASQPKIPVLFNHDPNRIVGFGELKVDGAIYIEGKFSEVTEEGRMVKGMLEEGFPMKQSVFIEPAQIKKIDEGVKFSVNGQSLEGPFTVFVDSTIKEVSMTAMPADINTETNLFNDRLNGTIKVEEIKMEKEIKKDSEEEIVLTNEQKFMEIAKTDLAEAFKFACSCETKETKLAVDEDGDGIDDETGEEVDERTREDLLEEIRVLTEELEELRSDALEQSVFSKFADLEANTGLKFSTEAKKSMLGLSEDQIDAVIKGVKVEKKKVIPSKLFTQSKNSESVNTFDITGLDLDSSRGFTKAAEKYMKFKASKGEELTQYEAVIALQKLVQK